MSYLKTVQCTDCGIKDTIYPIDTEWEFIGFDDLAELYRCPSCQSLQEESSCPCGCDDNPDHCVYASTCVGCGKKFFGYGYGATEYPCDDCRSKSPSWVSLCF